MNFKNTLKSSVAVAALYAVATPVTAIAADDTFSSGNKNSLKISGQIVKAITHADDGTSDKTYFSDGNWTSSRLRWVASGKLSDTITVGGAIEMNTPQSNTADSLTLGTAVGSRGTSADAAAWGIRHSYIYAKHKTAGKLTLGQTSVAADGSGEAKYTINGMFAGSDGSSYGSGVFFNNVATASAPTNSTVTVGNAITNMDHAGRADILRYDFPKFMNVSVKTSVKDDGQWDVGAAWSDKFDEFKVQAKAGFTDTNQDVSKNFIATGSIAVLHDSGLNASMAGGKTGYQNQYESFGTPTGDTAGDGIDDPHFFYVGIGYNAKLFGVGGTGFHLGWNTTDNNVLKNNHDDNEGEAWAISAIQQFKSIGTEIGIEYANYSYDSKSGTAENTFDDVDALTLMTVFKF